MWICDKTPESSKPIVKKIVTLTLLGYYLDTLFPSNLAFQPFAACLILPSPPAQFALAALPNLPSPAAQFAVAALCALYALYA